MEIYCDSCFTFTHFHTWNFHIPKSSGVTIDWFKGKIAGKSHISRENLWFPVDSPLVVNPLSVTTHKHFSHGPDPGPTALLSWSRLWTRRKRSGT